MVVSLKTLMDSIGVSNISANGFSLVEVYGGRHAVDTVDINSTTTAINFAQGIVTR